MITQNLKRAWEVSRTTFRDLVFIGGLAIVDYGIWLLSSAAAIIFGGLVIAAIAFFGGDTDQDEPRQ